MNAKEYLERSDSIELQIASLESEQAKLIAQCNELTNQYYNENAPKFKEGSIVRVTLSDGEAVNGFLSGFYLKRAEFRPILFKVRKGIRLKGKRIYYPLEKDIKHIERIGDCARCKNCLFAKIKGSRVYCWLRYKKGPDGHNQMIEISMDKIACDLMEFVVWKDGIPYHAKYQCGKEPKLTGGYFLEKQTIE